MPPHPHLCLLGSPRAFQDPEDPAALTPGKPLAALCFLALEKSRVTRDDLGAVLWPGVPQKRSRASVRQTLWVLRKELGSEAVTEENGELLCTETLTTDLDKLAAELADGELEAAWSRWAGGPFHAFTVPDAPRWNAWAERVRERWERRFGEALEAHAASRDGEERLRWLERAREVRPYRESVHAALVEAHLHERRLEDAEAALHRARSVVDEATPGRFEELEVRIQALRREAFEPDDDTGFHVEFVGRGQEFSELTRLWRSVRSGRMRLAGVLGPAGIGKTRLVDQVVELAEGEGAAVVEAKGVDSDASVPLGTVASLTKQLLRLPGAAGISSGSIQALRSLVPSEHRNGEPPAPQARAAALADAMADLVAAVAHEAPLVVRIEDLQWVDRSSAGLLLRVTRMLSRVPVLFLLTCRTEERDAAALRGLLRLEESGDALLVPLGPLSRSDVAELLTLAFAFDTPASALRSAARLHDATGGNPLFLLELLRHLEERGLIRAEAGSGDGSWQAPVLELPEVLELPRSVREVLERRLAELGEAALLVAATLAGSTTPLSVPELARLARTGEAATAKAVTELLRRDAVTWTRDDRLQLAHDSLRGILRGFRASPEEEREGPVRWARWAAVVAASLVLAALALGQPGMASSGAAFGGGVLFSRGSDQLVAHRVVPREDGVLALEPGDTIRLPDRFRAVADPRPAEAGGWVVPGIYAPTPGDAPDAWILEDGALRELWAEPGDDRTTAIGPTPGHFLVGSQAEEREPFRMDLYRYEASTGARVLLGEGIGRARWARDGSVIVASTEASRDSIVALRPDGDRIDAVPVPHGHLRSFHWCDRRGAALGLSLPPGGTADAWSWRPGEGTVEPLNLRYPASWLQCSPDGRAVAYGGWVGREARLVVEELDGDGVWVAEEGSGWNRFFWVDAAPEDAPRGVSLPEDSVLMQRGERVLLRPEVLGVDQLPAERGAWSSSDPLTASVRADGALIANAPGEAVVRYTVDGWLSDSVRVRVAERADRTGLLFSDALGELDPSVWRVEGHPGPGPASDDEGRPALSMNGDGRFTDGIVSREAFDLSHGATAEIDFHLPLTRADRQSVKLCLNRGRPLPEGSRAKMDWHWEEGVCFRWPAAELEDFDPGEAMLAAPGPPLGPIPVDGLIREGDWNRLSLELQADGTLSTFLNGTRVHTLPWRLELAEKRWHFVVIGRAADTRLLVRNATLWGEARYGEVRTVAR